MRFIANWSQFAMRTPLREFGAPLQRRAAGKKIKSFQCSGMLAFCWGLCVNLSMVRYLFDYAARTSSLAHPGLFFVAPAWKSSDFLWGPWPIAVNVQRGLPRKWWGDFCSEELPARRLKVFSLMASLHPAETSIWLPVARCLFHRACCRTSKLANLWFVFPALAWKSSDLLGTFAVKSSRRSAIKTIGHGRSSGRRPSCVSVYWSHWTVAGWHGLFKAYRCSSSDEE